MYDTIRRPLISRAPIVPWTEIELPPDLPMPVFTSNEPWSDKRIGALAMYCSDGRWGDAFDEFCHRRLGIPRYDRFAVPGGPAWVAGPTGIGLGNDDSGMRGSLLNAAQAQIEFLVKAHSLERIVLITHWGCAFYTQAGRITSRAAWVEQQRDANAAATNLRLWFPCVKVEKYLAMQLEGQISFHEVR